MRQPLHLAQSAALLLRDRPGQELRLAVKLKYATATQKKWPTQIIYATPLIAPHLATRLRLFLMQPLGLLAQAPACS